MLSLSFSKLVSTPTETVWSQAYNAGNLFATLALSKLEEDESQLSVIGKAVFSNLEAEFFTLENKDLLQIKDALLKSLESVPTEVTADITCAYFKDNILYIYLYGSGKILMRRNSKIGVLLENQISERSLKTASGLLENNDLIILQTNQFVKTVPKETLSDSLDLELPNDIAESLSPSMHEKDEGGQAAIIVNYKKPTEHTVNTTDSEIESDNLNLADDQVESDLKDPTIAEIIKHNEPDHQHPETPLSQESNDDPEKLADIPIHDYTQNPATNNSIPARLSRLARSILKIKIISGLSHKRRVYLSIATIIFIILTASIYLAKQKQENNQIQELFESIYTPALKDYEDGKSIESINEAFARDEFLNARNKLKEGEGKFKKGSNEDKKIKDLQAKIESELGTNNEAAAKVKTTEIKLGSNELLSATHENKSSKGIAIDNNTIYSLTSEAIINLDNNKRIISNENYWAIPIALSAYQGNLYVLDQKNGILKFTSGSDGFGKSNYFKTIPSNIKDAISMSIDGSIWLLFKDGSISQFTKGESDGFRIKGLNMPLKNATKIFTDLDSDSIYILDNGNLRIVKLSKDGDFEKQYVSDIIKTASNFEVFESDEKIQILSGDKFWEISL